MANQGFQMENGHCVHYHGEHKHQVPKFKCSSNAPKGSSCEDVAHEPTKGCPIEPKSDYDSKPLCAIGQPLNGMDWHGKPGCAATTRLMNLDDIDLLVFIIIQTDVKTR